MVNESDSCPVERGEDIEGALASLEFFVKDVAEGVSDHSPDILEHLKWCVAVLWLTSGAYERNALAPRLFEVINSDKGVSFTKIAELIPAFVKRILPLIDRRTDVELELRTRDTTPLTDDELPF